MVVALAISVIALAVALARNRLSLLKLAVRLAEAQKELQAVKSAPWSVEQRIERFDLLWFPSLTIQKDPPYILSVAAGLPHCRACVAPLKLQEGGEEPWVCLDCGARHPASLADTMVIDSIIERAIKEFLQRNKGYRLAPKKN